MATKKLLKLKFKAPKATKNAFLQSMLKGYATKKLASKVGKQPKLKAISNFKKKAKA